MPPAQPDRPAPSRALLAAAVALAVVPHLFLTAGPFIGRTFDGESHLFFASHYLRRWFDPWEPRWYGGFFVFSYPPLVHQAIALLGRAVGLETAYRLVQLAVVTGLPLSVWAMVRELADEQSAGWAALAAGVLSGTYLLLYAFGQLPNVAAVVFVMAAAAMFLRYLRDGRRGDLAATAACGCASVLATTTSQFTLPAVLIALLGQAIVHSPARARLLLGRGVRAAAALLALVAAALAPFWWWLAAEALPVAPIPHFTRENIFADPVSARVLFWGMYGGQLAVLPFLVLSRVLFARGIVVLTAACAVLAVVGLGGTTPVPRWLFGGLAQILVYERFAFWASVLLAVPVGLFFVRLVRRRPRAAAPAAGVFLAVSLAWSGWGAAFNLNQGWVPDQLEAWEEAELVRFLSAPEQGRWSYLLLGLDEAEAVRLTRTIASVTIDGYYAVARRPAELRRSGVGLLSAAKFFPAGPAVVERILRHPARWSLRWVVVADDYYTPLLVKTGWIPRFALGGQTAARLDRPYLTSAWLWEAPAGDRIPPYAANPLFTARRAPPWLAMIWGIAPLAVLAGALATTLGSLRRPRGG